jgi:Ran GTPase-activating protein (RanGAP) involved in mRNA processing and transport
MKADILLKYRNFNEKSKLELVSQVVRYLETSEEEDEEGNQILTMNFPGNETYNFNSRIKDEDMQPIGISFVAYKTNLTLINLSYNKISDKGILFLAKLLEKAEKIAELNLSGNLIGDSGCKELAASLTKKSSLFSLNLNGNVIGNSGLMYINELLFTNPSILVLNVGNNRYDWDGLIAITTALTFSNSTLKVLNVDDPMYKIQDQDFFTHFGKMFNLNKGLQKLSLKLHKIRFEGVNILTHYLKINYTMRVLDISCNQICFQGMKYISDYISDYRVCLQSLILSSNQFGNQGAKIFAQGLSLNKSLIHVDITSNMISDEGVCRLAEGLGENENVISFKLFWNNRFDVEGMKMFYDILKRKTEFYPDFTIYKDDTDNISIAYIETHVPNEDFYLVK